MWRWQCECPFHKLNDEKSCEKTWTLRLGSDWAASSYKGVLLLKDWADQANRYRYQRDHVHSVKLRSGQHPPASSIELQRLPAAIGTVKTDEELDAEVQGQVESDTGDHNGRRRRAQSSTSGSSSTSHSSQDGV